MDHPTNQLLAALQPEAGNAVQSRLDAVNLNADALLYLAGTVLRHVYFPVTAVVSLASPLRDGSCADVAVVGHEGVVDVCAFMGVNQALRNAAVQRPGLAWRMSLPGRPKGEYTAMRSIEVA